MTGGGGSGVSGPAFADLFPEHRRPTASEFTTMWDAAVFAIDANVLLNIYRMREAAAAEVIQTLASLGDRLWAPHQAIAEYARNRSSVIVERDNEAKKIVKGLDDLITKAADIKPTRHHFHLDVAGAMGPVRDAIDAARTALTNQQPANGDLLDDDPYWTQLATIIGNRVGDPYDDATLQAKTADATLRYAQSVPPGYKDADKPEPDRYGDALLWFQLLDHAKAVNKPVILVTDDAKEDWVQIISGRTIGPRPELRAEMRAMAGVDFYLYNLAAFLVRAQESGGAAVSAETIGEAEVLGRNDGFLSKIRYWNLLRSWTPIEPTATLVDPALIETVARALTKQGVEPTPASILLHPWVEGLDDSLRLPVLQAVLELYDLRKKHGAGAEVPLRLWALRMPQPGEVLAMLRTMLANPEIAASPWAAPGTMIAWIEGTEPNPDGSRIVYLPEPVASAAQRLGLVPPEATWEGQVQTAAIQYPLHSIYKV